MDDSEKDRLPVWFEDSWLFLRTMALVGVMGGVLIYGALVAAAGTVHRYEWKVKLPEVQPVTLGSLMQECAEQVGMSGDDDLQVLKEWAACVKTKREQHGL